MTTTQRHRYVIDLDAVDPSDVDLVGGKAANLARLTQLAEIRVPAGFCVSTDAFVDVVTRSAPVIGLLDQLAADANHDRTALREISAELRRSIEQLTFPDALKSAVSDAVLRFGEHSAYAVRSSATVEDSPTASYAGQHDSYLDVIGVDNVLAHIRRCWSSLFTDRAIAYRATNGIDHRQARMGVVVQHLVDASAAGVMFTADPTTSNRKLCVIEATPGLGEALVSGTIDTDRYVVRDGSVVESTIAAEPVKATSPDRGSRIADTDRTGGRSAALDETQAIELSELGLRVEAHFAAPQDIEWCLDDDDFWIVQTRPITTLFPVPESPDGTRHVWVSVGH